MEKRFNVKKFFLILGIILTLVITISTTAYAIYVRTNSFSGVVSSEKYYFESDLLVEGGKTYELNSGTTKVSFKVRNYQDELRISEVDINVTATSSGGTVELASPTLEKGSPNSLDVTLTGLVDGETYTVTVTGSGGYEKTLKATFVVRSVDKDIYKHIDTTNPAYILITVWSTKKSGEVIISFDGANIVADKTWPSLTEFNLEDTSITLSVSEYSSYVYRFFVKSDTDLEKISVTYNGSEVASKTPS